MFEELQLLLEQVRQASLRPLLSVVDEADVSARAGEGRASTAVVCCSSSSTDASAHAGEGRTSTAIVCCSSR